MDQVNQQNTEKPAAGFCGGCRSNCPLSDPNCPTGMERAGWTMEEIERAMAQRAVPIRKGNAGK
jgi:hypothetical protein